MFHTKLVGVKRWGSTTQAAPPHTRQVAEADFLGGLIGGGDALSHSQNAMEFCRLRQPSTCRGGGGGYDPSPDRAAQDTRAERQDRVETREKNGKENIKAACTWKKGWKRHQEKNASRTSVNEQKKKIWQHETSRENEDVLVTQRNVREQRGEEKTGRAIDWSEDIIFFFFTSFRSLSRVRCSVCCLWRSFLRWAVAVLWDHLRSRQHVILSPTEKKKLKLATGDCWAELNPGPNTAWDQTSKEKKADGDLLLRIICFLFFKNNDDEKHHKFQNMH